MRHDCPAAYRLAAVPALQHADVLLAAHLRPSPSDQDAADAHEAGHQRQATWLAPEVVAVRSGVVLIPAVSCLLAARSPFFRALFSGRWHLAADVRDAQGAERLDAAVAGRHEADRVGMAEVCLPVVRLNADAGAVLQLMQWMATGRMVGWPNGTAAFKGASRECVQCHQAQTSVLVASLAGEWLMDAAQDAAEDFVLTSCSAGDCCRRSAIDAAYAVHMEGLAHRLAKRAWSKTEHAQS